MFSVTGLEFAFTQAPDSMKSVIQAFWMVRKKNLITSAEKPIHWKRAFTNFVL